MYKTNKLHHNQHPLDENRLKNMANALAHYHVTFDHEALMSYCLENELIESAAIKTIEYFEKAQSRKIAVSKDIRYEFLRNQMNRTDW